MTEEPHYLETLYRDLAVALGNAVWAFARIEWLVYEYIGRFSSDQVDQLIGDLGFRPRTSILRKLIDRRADTEDKRSEAVDALIAAEKLADRRNIIVHNPWQIWIDIDAREFMTQIQKYSNRDKNLDLDELKEFYEEAGRTENRLKAALDAL